MKTDTICISLYTSIIYSICLPLCPALVYMPLPHTDLKTLPEKMLLVERQFVKKLLFSWNLIFQLPVWDEAGRWPSFMKYEHFDVEFSNDH